MDPERWNRIKDAFSAALDLPPEQRAEWLSITLPDDPSLAREVKSLLAAHDGAGDFYEQGALAALPEVKRQLEGEVEGLRVGPYRVISELGHGGMGAVYLAVRDQPSFTQKVALKLIKRGMDTDEIVRRFVAERQILASLAHPNIARLFDGGSTPDGRPYFVMEYVEGQPITTYAAEQKLSIENRLHLFVRVCRAVQHAHQSLVVHRDLKPANILVDAEGEPKLLDFGIAKLLDPSSFGGMTALTGLAPGPMTPDYASPEQRTGGPVTTATDVYGLGILLYELMVGQNPRAVEQRLGEGWAERPPNKALVALAPVKDSVTRRLARRVSGDLDTIVGKALEREPERRYGTAAALAEDVERHLTHQPVAARRPTWAYRLSRSLVRHKLAAALAISVCLLAVISTYYAISVSQERAIAEAQRQRAEALNQFSRSMFQSADPEQNRGSILTAKQLLDAGAQELRVRDTKRDAETWAALLETIGNTYADLGFYEDARRYLQQALSLRKRQRFPSPEAALDIAGNWTLLGHVAFKQAKYDMSRIAYKRAITIKQSLLGPDALPLAQDWNGLGLISFAKGNLASAGRYFAKSCAISRAADGGQRDLAEALSGLGKLAAAGGENDRAQVLFGAAWRYFHSAEGDDHPDTIQARSNLAFALFHRAEYARAETLYQEIVDMRRRLLGPDHPDLASALLELAIAQRQCRHLDKAHATLDEVLQIRRQHHFPADEGEAETWNFLGHVNLDQNRTDDAGEAFQKSLATYRSLPGDHRSDLARVLSGQAQTHSRSNDLPGAISLARRSLELTIASVGGKNPSVSEPLELLAGLLLQDRQFRNAETAYRQALDLLSSSAWSDHPKKAHVMIGLGELLVETKRAGEALPYLDKGLRIQQKALPEKDPWTARAESELGACFAALHNDRAQGLLEHGFQALQDIEGADHPDTRKAKERLLRLRPPAG